MEVLESLNPCNPQTIDPESFFFLCHTVSNKDLKMYIFKGEVGNI